MKKILIWGIGDRTRYYMLIGYFANCEIKGFIDTYKKSDKYSGYNIYFPEDILDIEPEIDYIVIANEFYGEIIEKCIELKINMDKVIITDNIPLEPYHTYYLRVKDISEKLFEALEKAPFVLVRSNEYDLVDQDMKMTKGKYSYSIYMQDYFRFRTFEFIAKEIEQNNVFGAVAELGVFRGTFSSLINEHFKNRKIYLFDTFEGFESEEASEEIAQGRCDEDFVKEHRDTSVERMLSNLPYPEKARVCKGFFPDSITEEAMNEKYAFVSLDVDFEESMYQGLKFFYPRLSDGGVIFVHDYNTYYLDGIRKAVLRFEKEIGIMLNKIPIADRAGTLIIMKR